MRAKFPKRVCCYFDRPKATVCPSGFAVLSIGQKRPYRPYRPYVHVCMHMYTCMCMLHACAVLVRLLLDSYYK